MYPQRNRDSLMALFIKQGLNERFPLATERLALEDITIPDLRRTIRYAMLLEQDDMIRKQGLSWDDFTEGKGRGTASPPAANPMLYAQEPAGGFSRAEKRIIAELDKKYRCRIPAPIAQDFTGLTDLEARIAFSEHKAVGAALVGAEHYPELNQWVKDTAKEIGIPEPRLIITESDMPYAMTMSFPRTNSPIFITRNIKDMLSESKFKSVIAHEMNHLKDHYEKDTKNAEPVGWKKRIIRAFMDNLVGEHPPPPYPIEYESDERGALHTSTGDTADALITIDARTAEIGKFSETLRQFLKDEGIALKELPGYFQLLASFSGRQKPIPGVSRPFYLGNDEGDDHPPTLWRLEHLNDTYEKRGR